MFHSYLEEVLALVEYNDIALFLFFALETFLLPPSKILITESRGFKLVDKLLHRMKSRGNQFHDEISLKCQAVPWKSKCSVEIQAALSFPMGKTQQLIPY